MGKLPTKQDLKSVKGKEQDDVVMALTQAIGPDEAIKLLEMCDMSKHAEKLVSSKGNPDGPLPKWGEPPVDAMNKTPGQKKKKKEVEEACWDGYKKVGMKKKGKKSVPNCVPEEKEVKTIKVGEDAVGSDQCHYALVMDRKVTAVGSKDDMLAKCKEEGGRVWVSTKKVGDVVEERSAQDPDIKDRKGTQPAAYHKGLKKTTKTKRDAHFKKHGKKSDDDASAYKDAPGDKKARKKDMPKSKYTKFVDKMMDEEHEFHVRLDHLDGDKRQDKAGNVLRKHEKAGHIKFDGETDKGVVFKAKSKSHADRLHRELKPHATGVEHMNEAAEYHVTRPGGSLKKPDSVHKSKTDAMKAAYRLSGNKHRGAHGGQVYRVHKGTVSHGFDTEGRTRHLGLDHGKVTGKKPIGEAKYAVDIEGMPRFYMNSDSPAKVKIALRQMLKKATAVKSVTRTYDTNIKADLRQRLKDASTDMQTNIVSEKLKASDDMGKWVDDFKDSDAPQFKGKSMKKRRQMAIAAKLSAMREGTEAYGKSVNKMADDKKKDAMSSSDKNKLGKIADMMKKERQMKEGAESNKAHGRMFKAAAKKQHDAQQQAEREKRLKAKGWVKNDRGGMSKVSEAMGDAAHKAAVKHITDLGKKNKMSVGQQRMHIDNNPGKHDEKTRQAAKTINKNQFGNWKKGKDGKMTQEEAQIDELSKKTMGSYVKKASQSATDHGAEYGKKKADQDSVNRSLNRHGMTSQDKDDAHKAFKTSDSDVRKPEMKAAKRLKGINRAVGKMTQEEAQKKDHQTISYVTHGGQKGKVQVHKDNAFKALNHYRKNNKSAQFEETGSWKTDSGWKKAPAERKDEYGNTIKKQNIAKHLAKKAMNKTKAMGEKK